MASDEFPYVIGPTDPRTKKCATFEHAKPGDGSGAGYERWRSTEYRPHTARQSSEDVYVSVHRLQALLLPELFEKPIEDAIAELDGADVHHSNGVKWDNRLSRREADGETNLEVLDHGEHASVTQSEMRAWAEDAKQQAATAEPEPAPTAGCTRCGTTDDMYVVADDLAGHVCVECTVEVDSSGPFEAVDAGDVAQVATDGGEA